MNRRCPHLASAALALIVVANVPPAAAQSAADPATEIVQKFGTGGLLGFEGLRNYLAEREFTGLDVNGDGELDPDEHRAALLFVRQADCLVQTNASARWLEEKAVAAGPVDAGTLYRVNPVWKLHIDEMAAAHWDRTRLPRDGMLTRDAVREYLRREQARVPAIPTAQARLAALLGPTPSETIVLEARLRAFFRDERFGDVDRDGNGRLDFFEFTRGFSYAGAPADFCAFASSTFLITKSDFDDQALRVMKARALHNDLVQFIDTAMKALSPVALDVSVERITRIFTEQEKAARSTAALKGVGGRGFVPGFGYLLRGKREEEDGKIAWDRALQSVFLRVIKDFTIDDPVEAEPAVFSVAKKSGGDAAFTIDAAFQIDVRPVSATILRFSTGVDLERFTAQDAERNRQRVYGTLDLFFFTGGRGIESNYIRFAPFIDNDQIKATTRLAGDVIWQPGIHVGHFLTSAWRPLGRSVEWYVTPRAVLELATAVRKPAGAQDADETHGRLELLWGLTVRQRFNATYKTFQRRGIGNALGHSHFEEVSAWWNFDDLHRFSFKTTLAHGRDTPTSVEATAFNAGLGVKF